MKAYLYRIDCLTNLHVGSGEENYSIVDKEVIRDSVTDEPIIPASGVKGAIRSYFQENSMLTREEKLKIFGQEVKTGSANNDIIPGAYRFLSAYLIARPLRISTKNGTFIRTSSAALVNHLLRLIQDFNIEILGKTSLQPIMERSGIYSTRSRIKIEGDEITDIPTDNEREQIIREFELLKSLTGDDDVALANPLNRYSLPVIARNQLDDGVSNNLWYEQYVPHQSVFYFVVLAPKDSVNTAFDEILDGSVIQFGGNASVGYGYCKVTKVGESHEQTKN